MAEKKRPRRNLFDEIASWLSPDKEEGEERKGRGRLAQLFAILGTAFAVLQLLFSALDLANRAVTSVLSWLPYLIPAMFVVGAAASIYFLATAAPGAQRKRAGGALAVIVVAGAAWGGWTYYQATRPPKAVIVVVADFESQEATKGVDWGRRIYERVRDQVGQLDLDERVEVQRVFEAYGTSEEAVRRGKARKATVVLWGWYDDLGVSPHFELLRTAEKLEPSLAAPAQDLTDFDVYAQSGPQEMAYVVSVVLGLVHYVDGNYLAAESLFSTALANAPPESSLLGLEVSHFYRANARLFGYDRTFRPMEGIVSDLQEAVSLKPDFRQAHWNLSLVYLDYCSPFLAIDEALAQAEKVRELRPADADSYWLLGQIHAEREEWQQAEGAHRQALQLNPAHADAQEGLAKALEQLGRSDEANRAYALALEIRQEAAKDGGKSSGDAPAEDPAELQDRLGYAYLNAGQYDQAITALEEALRLQPENAEFHRHLGNAYYWQGKPEPSMASSQVEQAISEYEAARSLDASDGLLLTVLGGAYNEAGRPEDALRAYEDAVRVAPCDDDALLLLATQYDSLGHSEDAVAAYRQLVQLNPRQAIGWQWLAAEAYLRDDYAAAAEAYRSGLDADPQSVDLHYGLGVSLYWLGDYEGSEKAYRQAGILAPDDTAVLTGWGDALAALGRMDEAVAAYERAVEVEPDNPYYWEALALGYTALGRPDDVLRAVEETLRYNPDSVAAYLLRGGVYEGSGELEKARGDYQQALVRSGDTDPWKQIAEEALQRVSG